MYRERWIYPIEVLLKYQDNSCFCFVQLRLGFQLMLSEFSQNNFALFFSAFILVSVSARDFNFQDYAREKKSN